MNNKENIGKIERRYFDGPAELRAHDGENDDFDFGGLASRTGHEYIMHEDTREVWTEIIDRRAFDGVTGQDIRVLFNHDDSTVLGRTTSGTARVWVDADGLRYAWKNPASRNDIAELIARGDINQSSFGFRTARDNNEFQKIELEDGRVKFIRTIKKFDQVFDVSPVTFPANPATTAGERGGYESALNEYRSTLKEQEQKQQQRKDEIDQAYLELDLDLKEKEISL